MSKAEQIKQRLVSVQDSIAAACIQSNRDSASVKLIAVSKRMPISAIKNAFAAGQLVFGENYADELIEKAQQLYPRYPQLGWHMIGPLQRRQIPKLPKHTVLIHTLDRLKLLDRFERTWIDPWPPFLVQVNIGQEPQKAGLAPGAIEQFLEDAYQAYPNVRIQGLMTIPPAANNPEETRPYFVQLRKLADTLSKQSLLPEQPQLSMGMSQDYPIAIAEGATMVRVGTAIFGARHDV